MLSAMPPNALLKGHVYSETPPYKSPLKRVESHSLIRQKFSWWDVADNKKMTASCWLILQAYLSWAELTELCLRHGELLTRQPSSKTGSISGKGKKGGNFLGSSLDILSCLTISTSQRKPVSTAPAGWSFLPCRQAGTIALTCLVPTREREIDRPK